MSNSGKHALMGLAIGAGLYCIFQKAQNQEIELEGMMGYGALGAFAGVLPDILEPANSPVHRQLAHSIFMSLGLSIGQKHVLERQDLSPQAKLFWSTIFAGYGSHLLLDSTTPAGLPAI